MRDVRVAELLLSIVMPRDRAAATVGDMLESSRGPLVFWAAYSRTLVGTALRQISIGTCLKAIAIGVLVEALVGIPYTWILIKLQPQGYLGLALFLGLTRLMPIFAGYIVARCLRHREMGAWIALVLAWSAALMAVSIATPLTPAWAVALSQLWHMATLLVGALLARRMTLRKEFMAA